MIPGDDPGIAFLEDTMGEKRISVVGVKMTPSEAEALREVAFRERTTKSSLLRRLFIERYLKRRDEIEQT